jgi:hypothetical protein
MANHKISSEILHQFFRASFGDQMDEIEPMLKTYQKEKNRELEVAFMNISYPDYLRILEYFVNKISQDNIENTESLDININMENGDTKRIMIYDRKEIENVLNTSQSKLNKNIKGKNIIYMLKKKSSSTKIISGDLNLVIKLTEEIPLEEIKLNHDKIFFRYKQRASFTLNKKFRLDITDVKGSAQLNTLLSEPSRYEIELEAIDKVEIDSFLQEIYSLLQLIQDSEVPIIKTEKEYVLNAYQKILHISHANQLEVRNAVNIAIHHLINFVPNRYAITDKADGERYFLFILPEGVYLLSMNLNVRKLDLHIKDKKYFNCLIDGELIKYHQKNIFLAFDLVYAFDNDYRFDKKSVLKERLANLEDIISNCFGFKLKLVDYASKHTKLDLDLVKNYYVKTLTSYWKDFRQLLQDKSNLVAMKIYFIPYGIDSSEIFLYADMVWKLYVYNQIVPYKLDGIIYTPLNSTYSLPVTPKELDTVPLEYKWKPPSQNSIDFYIQFEKDSEGNDMVYYDDKVVKDRGNAYKICQLYVGEKKGNQEIPVPFIVNKIEQKAILYLKDEEVRDRENKIIEDETVVEFIFDNSNPELPDSYKWIPLRTRYDKTEAVIKYKKKYGNSNFIAKRIWDTIINPITEDHIASLANPETYAKEIDILSKSISHYSSNNFVYYQQVSSNAKNMRSFHNWIKNIMITSYCRKDFRVLDIGCGRGGDIMKFINAEVKEYVGIDIDYNSLFVINDSALKRYQSFKEKMEVPPMYFINVDARGLFTVSVQEKILPRMTEKNKNYIKRFLSGNQKYQLINCQFSLHYYLSDEIYWSNFCKNINQLLDVNGYFLITCFDGQLLYDKIKEKSHMTITYNNIAGNKIKFFEIKKVYDDKDKKQIGMAIDVYNSLISKDEIYIREYLVFPEFLISSLKEKCKLELVETDLFSNIFNLYKNYFVKEIYDDKTVLNISAKKYAEIRDFYLKLDPKTRNKFGENEIEANLASYKLSILNRYYIFKKAGAVELEEPARIVGMNHQLNVGRILSPYFHRHLIYLDPTLKSRDANTIYQYIKKTFDTRPYVYLIKHYLRQEKIGGDFHPYNQVNMVQLKKGLEKQALILFKSPQRMYYPLFYQRGGKKKYLFNSPHIIRELNSLLIIFNKL